ncbi:MAG: penicillin-binding protein 2 [Candidatus Saganbacteria bacterium]|nr:penicillin-binding protein 2 [Candidatus Saganbacteria bacterium]
MKKLHIIVAVFLALFLLLFMRLVQLQMIGHGKLALLALENAAKTVPEPAPRGVIYDRYDRVLVESRPIFAVRVLPYVLAGETSEKRKDVLEELGRMLNEKIELKVKASEPLLVKENISLETAVRIAEKARDLPGVVVTSQPVRLYPHGDLAAHLLGYVGEIEAKELDELRGQGYRLGDIIGKDGVEKTYDKLVRGVDGGKKVEVDVYGTPLRILESLEPRPGPDMTLTIDLGLQQEAEKLLAQREGAVIVMSARTGEILAMASYPNYDPNIFSDPLLNYKWQDYKKQKHPFMNRALAHYPPGSIFKIITLAAALEEGKASWDEIIDCRGYYRVNNRIAKCWLEGGHGPISVREGLVWSCDVVFYELGKRLGPDLIAKYAEKFGLGRRSGIDLPQEKRGNVPDAKWKKRNLGEEWYDGDSINYGIGQGWVQVTPLQMTVAYTAVATGNIFRPYVVKEIKDSAGEIIYQGKAKIVNKLDLSPETIELIRGALHDVVDRATGVSVRFSGVTAAGKTGTAENPGKAHAWFICYAPYEHPEVVIAAFVAHGEHGDTASAHLARDMLKWYKENRLTGEYEVPPYAGQYILQKEKFKVPYGRKKEQEQKPQETTPAPEQTEMPLEFL